ncbi:hypothetical protein KEM52_006286 [Ascosphaera acerosa]|nr:hypothetical protein KEM52_006286 [Ascosphaera acerosa]
MRLAPVVAAALPVLASAQQQAAQAPLSDMVGGWFNKAKSIIPANVLEAIDDLKSQAASQASKFANDVAEASAALEKAAPAAPVKPKHVTEITSENWQEVFKPLEEPTTDPEKLEWMMLVTGGNKTCFGRCGQLNKAWEDAIPLFSLDPTSPSLARLDCEKEGLLCNTILANPPYIHHIRIPIKDAEHPDVRPPTEIVQVRLNTSTVNPDTVYDLHAKNVWKDFTPNTSFMHPFDSQLARSGLLIPFGYVLYGFSKVPSWLLMVSISMFSRTIM